MTEINQPENQSGKTVGGNQRECLSCVFFHVDEDGDDEGDCRRYPPRSDYDKESEFTSTDYPRVGGSFWCGEYKDRTAHGSGTRKGSGFSSTGITLADELAGIANALENARNGRPFKISEYDIRVLRFAAETRDCKEIQRPLKT